MSFTCKERNEINDGAGPWIWKSRYTIYHRAGSLFPDASLEPKYAQLFFYDPEEALHWRMKRNVDLDRRIMDSLQNMLISFNKYNHLFLHTFEVLHHTPSTDIGLRILADPATDLRRYNSPTVDEIAVIVPGDDSQAFNPRDVVLHGRDGHQNFIHDYHRAYAPLHYVLLFPYGTDGWTYGLPQFGVGDNRVKNISQVQFYSYRLHTRNDEFPTLQSAGRLFQQYVCDVWVSTDQNRLCWIESNQPQLRAELYSGLEDAASTSDSDVELEDVGHRIVLPSSYIGGPRYMNQRFQDAIALARFYHGFDLFITFTCNTQWTELTDVLLHGQAASDRPDVTAQVFNMYKSSLIDDLRNKNIFGRSLAYVHTIEFQKRGLPHMHLLLTLSPEFRLTTPEQVDCVIKALWLDPDVEPRLFSIVSRRMVHGPCGPFNPQSPCMKDGKCSKGFLKPFQEQTVLRKDGYPTYARPNDGQSYKVGKHMVDNRWIIPYNPYLLSRYNAHINVECVMSLAAAKYITKYTHKGSDRATLEIQRRNEVSDLRDCRYISASEASWRIFELPIHHQQPAVMSLQVHLPGQHMVVFDANDSIEEVTARAQQEQTMLTSFFTLNSVNENARQYSYQELPLHFVWNRRDKVWTPRKIGGTIGRLYFVSPTTGERFYLRTLLTTVRGPTNWDDLRSYDGILYPSFHAACLARGLLENDDEWRQCLEEASLTHVGERMRCLFSLILRNCFPSQPDLLWLQFRENLCDDLQHKLKRERRPKGVIPQADVYDYGLFLIEQDLRHHGSSLSSFPSMPVVQNGWDDSSINKYIVEQLAYDTEKEKALAEQNIAMLNAEQRSSFDQIIDAVRSENGRGFFLHGAGGTGKTFVYQTLCHSVRSDTLIALCAASSGIAALLLPGGHTAHSTFAIPVDFLDDKSSCAVKKNSKKADMLRSVRLIIWDEAVTQHRYAIEAVDRMLQDVRSDPWPFGGICVVFGGDFRQTLPIVQKGTRADIVHATIQNSPLWEHLTVLHLRENMRVRQSRESHLFCEWLLDIGRGTHDHGLNANGTVDVPLHMRALDESDLINCVYNSMSQDETPPQPSFFRDRAILAPGNDEVRSLNSSILKRHPGPERVYQSADSYTIEPDSGEHNSDIPLKFLHSLNASGLPVSDLCLKVGCPVIILRNIDTKRGLCNGTRATVIHMTPRVLHLRLLGGDHNGETALVPRITLSPSTAGLNFAIKLNRRQFPVQLAYAMTIHKSQGQSLNQIGIDLRKPNFAHGQLYVAFSQATSPDRVKVLLSADSRTQQPQNVVYNEVLLDRPVSQIALD